MPILVLSQSSAFLCYHPLFSEKVGKNLLSFEINLTSAEPLLMNSIFQFSGEVFKGKLYRYKADRAVWL